MTAFGSDVLTLPIGNKPRILRIGGLYHGDKPDNRIEKYEMKDVWCVHFYHYNATLVVNGDMYEIHPKSVSISPPWATMEWYFLDKSYHVSAFFIFEKNDGFSVPVPVMHYLDELFDPLYDRFQEAMEIYPLSPQRAEVRLWDILWSLVEHCDTCLASKSQIPLHMRRAVGYIERNLHKPLRVRQIAEIAHVTPTHLTRLFRRHFSMTVVGYIRWRRANKARDMLIHSDYPIKNIAEEVGFYDLQHFYKTMKSEFGSPPAQIRADKNCQGNWFSI